MTRILPPLLLLPVMLAAAEYDLLIRNARVLDGTGNPWYTADIGVKGGRIQTIGVLGAATAARTIDAAGRFVAPGFIDIHSHSDHRLADLDLRYNLNMVAQGITLSVVNQDGSSAMWPLSRQREVYARQGIGNHIALLVGHATVRSRVMRGRNREPATGAGIQAMQRLVEEGMKDGAFGLSTGLEYEPGRFSETSELVALTSVLKPYGGFYISHQRSEGKDPMWKDASDRSPAANLLEAVAETIRIGRETGVPVVCSHFKAKGAGYWGSSYAAVRLIQEAREQGIQVYADHYPYDTSASDGNTVLIPRWALADLEPALADPASARRLRGDIEHEIERRGGASRIVVYEFPDTRYVEKSLEWIASGRKLSPVDAAIWIQRNGLKRPGGARMRGFSLAEIDIEHIMRQEFTATSTDGNTMRPDDGVVHPRSYGTYPRKIRRYALERGIISLAFAIRSMTSLPARIMGLKDRGLIHEGYWADLVIFDPAHIADKATFGEPRKYAEGIPYVFVDGVAVVDDGKLTKATPGRVLTPFREARRGS